MYNNSNVSFDQLPYLQDPLHPQYKKPNLLVRDPVFPLVNFHTFLGLQVFQKVLLDNISKTATTNGSADQLS